MLLLVAGAAIGSPGAQAASGPALTCYNDASYLNDWFGQRTLIDDQCVDAGATADSEPTAAVDQPLSSDPAPGFDSITGSFGGPFSQSAEKWRMSPAITIGGGYVYVATDNTSAPYGPGVYMYSTGDGCPANSTAPAGALCKVAQVPAPGPDQWRPNGITYYRGKVYVSRTDARRNDIYRVGLPGAIQTFDANLNDLGTKRSLAVTGLDGAWGELWGRISDVGIDYIFGASMDFFAILDPDTAAVRGLVPVGLSPTPRIGDEGPTGPCCSTFYPEYVTAKDVAISPELDVVSSAGYSMRRLSAQALLAADPMAPARSPVDDGMESDLNGDPGCYDAGPFQPWKDSPVGAYAPWGMKWLIQIDNNCPVRSTFTGSNRTTRSTVKEYALSLDVKAGPAVGMVYRTSRRTWRPQDQTTDSVRDIAYQAHEPRITWSGRPTESPWQHGNQTLTYFVSDGEFYTVARQIERWLDPANGFQNVVLKAAPTNAQGQPAGSPIQLASSTNWSGTLTINEDNLPSGTYQLTMTATIGGGKTVTKTNPNFRVDHTTPTGSLDGGLPAATNTTVNATGTLADTHAGPAKWKFQINGPGTNGTFRTVCDDTAPDPSTGKWGCTWKTNDSDEGTYQVQALLEDQVQPTYGGANTLSVGSGTVIVDRTPPSITNTAPNLYQDAYETATEQLEQVNWTQYDDRAGIADTAIQVDASGSSNSGEWTNIGSSPAAGDTTVDWNTDSVPNGLYTLRARTCDRAGNCSTYPWQAEMARVRRANSKCGPNLGYGNYCYVGRASGNDRYYSSYGTRANIYTPAPIKAQEKYVGVHSVAHVGVGQGWSRQWLQTGLSTDCGANMQGGYNYTENGKDYWGTYVEYNPPRGPRKYQCFSKGATPTAPGVGTQPAAGQYQNYAIDVVKAGARARAFIGAGAKVITNTSSSRDEQVWKQSGYLLRKIGQRNSKAVGEILPEGRQMSGAFASWETAYTSTTWSSTRPTPRNIIDEGYILNEASTTRWCVADTKRGCSNP